MQYFSIPFQVFHNGSLICEDIKAIQIMPKALSNSLAAIKTNIKREFAERMNGKRIDVFVSPSCIEPINEAIYQNFSGKRNGVLALSLIR